MNVTSTTHGPLSPADPPAGPAGPVAPPGFVYESETFQHYQVLRREDGSLWELGRGAMGVTYKAFDTNLRCHVALKVISAQHLHSEVAGQRFIREARVAARLRHRNIATVYHLGVDPQGFFYSMEFIDGETLEDLVARVGPLPLEMVLRIALQTARALAAASRQGLIHRDIKPANLMVLHQDEDGEERLLVKVIDFGLARSYTADDSNAQLTATGFVGTPRFASPEQLEEKDLDVRSDIYSLGITLWILLTGRPPFDGKMTVVITQHLHAEPPWWQLGDSPGPIRSLLERMLCKDPAHRYQSAGELRLAVEACLRQVTGKDSLSTEGSDSADFERGPSSQVFVKPDAELSEAAANAGIVSTPRPPGAAANTAQLVAAPPARPASGRISFFEMGRRLAEPRAGRRLLRPRVSLVGAMLFVLCALGVLFWRGLPGTPDAVRSSARPRSGATPLQKTAAAQTLTAAEPAPPAGVPRDREAEPTAAGASSFLLHGPGAALGVPSVDLTPDSPPQDAGNPSTASEDAASAPASPAPAVQPVSQTPGDKEGKADDGSPGTPAKGQPKTSQRTRSHHGSRSAATPAPNFFQKLFGIKPKPHSS